MLLALSALSSDKRPPAWNKQGSEMTQDVHKEAVTHEGLFIAHGEKINSKHGMLCKQERFFVSILVLTFEELNEAYHQLASDNDGKKENCEFNV